MDISLKNEKLSPERFYEIRSEVLNQWSTGAGIELEEAFEYQRAIAPEKRFSQRLAEAEEKGETLIQPRAGVALVDEHIHLLQYLEEEGEADLLPTTIDSYTRLNRYQEAEIGIEESKKSNRSMLNGFPAVNYGTPICRIVSSSVKKPVQVRHGTPDARLLAEITLAGGFTSFEGGGISYNIPYSKNHTLQRTLSDWQYVDRLVGLYAEAGIIINREPFGPLTGTLVPPCISNVVAVVETLLAATQGVKDITIGYGQCGNLVQDAAAIKSLKKLTREYLDRFGFEDCVITTVLHQWMGGFPADEAKAFGVISWGAATAVLTGVTKVIVKTPYEAMGVPTKEANAAGLKATRQLVNMLCDQKLGESAEIDEECEILEAEMRCILEKMFEFGKDDIALGAVRGFEAGIIDVPFAPSRYNAGRVMPARDITGAVRFFQFGNIPFTEDIIAFHREKLVQRGRAERREVSFQMVVDDIYAISKGRLVGHPNG